VGETVRVEIAAFRGKIDVVCGDRPLDATGHDLTTVAPD
jgi:hypothetical protein